MREDAVDRVKEQEVAGTRPARYSGGSTIVAAVDLRPSVEEIQSNCTRTYPRNRQRR